MNQREILVRNIRQVNVDLQTAETVHRRDLQKRIHRMKLELWDYDRFQSAACQDTYIWITY